MPPHAHLAFAVVQNRTRPDARGLLALGGFFGRPTESDLRAGGLLEYETTSCIAGGIRPSTRAVKGSAGVVKGCADGMRVHDGRQEAERARENVEPSRS